MNETVEPTVLVDCDNKHVKFIRGFKQSMGKPLYHDLQCKNYASHLRSPNNT